MEDIFETPDVELNEYAACLFTQVGYFTSKLLLLLADNVSDSLIVQSIFCFANLGFNLSCFFDFVWGCLPSSSLLLAMTIIVSIPGDSNPTPL